MPKGQAFDLEVFSVLEAKKTKKTGEAGVEILAPAASKRFRLLGLSLTASAEDIIILSDEATVFFMITVPKTPTTVSFNFPMQGYLSKAAANKLIMNTKTAEREITGVLYGIEDVL